MTKAGPLLDTCPGLRQRQLADDTWSIWWEPNAKQRAAGATRVDLSAMAPGDALRRARALHKVASAKLVKATRTVATQRGTMQALIDDYVQSKAFRDDITPVTQGGYCSYLTLIATKWGTTPVVNFDRPMVGLWYEALLKAHGAWRANATYRMLSILMSHAEYRGLRVENSNPCRKIKQAKTAGRTRVATWPEIDALLAAARKLGLRHIRLGILLALMGGQRQTDARLVRPDAFFTIPGDARLTGSDRPIWIWNLTQNKRGRVLQVPLHRMIVPVLRAQLVAARNAGPGTLIWDPSTGKPLTKERYFHYWEQVRALAATTVPSVATLQARDLRRSFGTLSRLGGTSRSDVADVLGNTAGTNHTLADAYMPQQIETSLRAVNAIARPADTPPGKRRA